MILAFFFFNDTATTEIYTLSLHDALPISPRIFHVNWFRQNPAGRFLWPGYGENLRVLAWLLERCAGRSAAQDSAIGLLPQPQDINITGLDIERSVLDELTTVPPAALRRELAEIRAYLRTFGEHTPAALFAELDGIERRLEA